MGVDWVASHPPFGETKHKKKLKEFVNIMLSGQVPHCNFCLVALLVFLVK